MNAWSPGLSPGRVGTRGIFAKVKNMGIGTAWRSTNREGGRLSVSPTGRVYHTGLYGHVFGWNGSGWDEFVIDVGRNTPFAVAADGTIWSGGFTGSSRYRAIIRHRESMIPPNSVPIPGSPTLRSTKMVSSG